jgi:hypothetical protein
MQVQLVADWSEHFAPGDAFKAFYDKKRRSAVVAGVSKVDSTIRVRMVSNISEYENSVVSVAAETQLAIIQRTAYNVWDDDGTLHPSYDVTGMQPRAVLYDACPSTFRSMQRCYVIYMERPANMDFMRAYVPETGGIDVEFYSYSSSLMDNALGHPMRRIFGSNVYTLRGTCFQMENRFITSDGKSPPIVTLGNACKRLQLGVKCALPFNNPFLTDTATTPILLPDGLSVTHTHLELSQIFSATCNAADLFGATAQNGTALPSGPRLYQSILRSVHANTLPVDFVELGGGIADVVYVTPTTLGLISTKRILFFDRLQNGYVRATRLIYCPPKFFGVVGGVCRPCADGDHRFDVAYQIQCTGAVFETFTIVASKSVSIDNVRDGLCLFAAAKNVSCSSDVSMVAQPQPFNMAADGGGLISITRCLVAAAERSTGRLFFRYNNIAEYASRIISDGRHILDAVASTTLRFDNYTDASTARQCGNALVRGVGGFLDCAIPKVIVSRRRRLLADAGPSLFTEQHGASLGSITNIVYSDQQAAARREAAKTSGTSYEFPTWAIVLVCAAAAAAAAAGIIWLRRRRNHRGYERISPSACRG